MNSESLVAWAELNRWLGHLYAPALAPTISQNTETHRKLSQLYHLDQLIKHISSIVHRIQTEATTEYQALVAHNSYLLTTAGLPTVQGLPASTQEILSRASQLASQLGLSTLRPDAFETALASETMVAFKRQMQMDVLQEQADRVQARIEESRERQRLLQRKLEQRSSAAPIEEQKAREWMRNAKVVAAKTQEYRDRLGELELQKTHEYAELKALDAKVSKREAEVREKRKACDAFGELPPDIPLAYLKLEEANNYLAQVRLECEDAVAAAFR